MKAKARCDMRPWGSYIEVQRDPSFGEDDIVRLQDDYRRTDSVVSSKQVVSSSIA